jgi:hypothetical protein
MYDDDDVRNEAVASDRAFLDADARLRDGIGMI